MTDPVDVALCFVFCINRQLLDELSELMTENHRFDDGTNLVTVGRTVMKENWRRYFELCPDYLIHLAEIYPRDHQVVLVGHTTGSHLEVPWHQEFALSVIWVAEILDERVDLWKIVEDSPSSRMALGIPNGQSIH